MNYGNWATDAAGRITFTPYAQPQQSGTKAELYSYNADGYLVSMREASSGYDYLTGLITPPDLASAFTRALTSYDAMGRVTGYVEYNQSNPLSFGDTMLNRAGWRMFIFTKMLHNRYLLTSG